jgi:hypothetical protein
VAWYAQAGRIHIQATRLLTLVAMSDAWAADMATGHDAVLLAWRRNDVADLNRLARNKWASLGHLHGGDVYIDGGRPYAVGDRLVVLAPNHRAGLVTSEPLTVIAVDQETLTVRAAQGRQATLRGEELDTKHLDYGYALTIHRAQGATHDRAHVLAAGGGRELAYVGLSRARDHTAIHATADDLAQAVDDLQADWGVARHQRWITDTPAHAGHLPQPAQATTPTATVRPLPNGSVGERRLALQERLDTLIADDEALRSGTGRWLHTSPGHAARAVIDANTQLEDARRAIREPDARRRERRAAAKALPGLESAVAVAEQQWLRVGAPVVERLHAEIRTTRRELADVGREALTQRLDRLQERPPARPLGLEFGLGL